MKKLLLAATMLFACEGAAHAANVTLDFGSLSIGGSGPCVADCVIGTGGLRAIGAGTGVSAEGYNTTDHPAFLTQKPSSANVLDERGIGESNSGKVSTDPQHEIAVGDFVVIDNTVADALGFKPQSFTIGSMQRGERGAIYGYTGPDGGSNLVPGDLTLLASFNGTDISTFDVSGFSYDKYVFGSLKATGDTASNIILTSEVLAAPGVPEASTWAMLLIGFGLLGLAARSRKDGLSLS